MIKMFIGNEEVVSNHEFTIKEEMLSASSTILNNCYPKSWELTKDYVSNFYYPKDYSKFVLASGEFEHGNTEYSILDVSGNQPQFETNVEKEWNSLNIYGKTEQATAPEEWGKNLLYLGNNPTVSGLTITKESNSSIKINGTASSNVTLNYNLLHGKTLDNQLYSLSIISSEKLNDRLFFTFANLGDLSAIEFPANLTSISRTSTSLSGKKPTQLAINIRANTVFNNTVIQLQLQQGSVSAFEPATYTPPMPSPDRPSELNSVGYENLLENTATTQEVNDLIINVNDNGLIVINGTASALTTITLSTGSNINNIVNLNSSVTLSGCPSGGSNSTYELRWLEVGGTTRYDYGNGVTFTPSASSYGVYIVIRSGVTCNNLVFKPMITKGTQAHSYIPYGKYGIEVKTTDENNNMNTYLYALDNPLRSIGDTKDLLYIQNGMLYVERNIRHLEFAISDMNNNDNYPGWKPIPQLLADYPNVNNRFETVANYMTNISSANSSVNINTNSTGLLFLPKEDYGLTQTQWKSNYSDLIFNIDYVMPNSYTEEIGQVNIPSAYNGINNVFLDTGIVNTIIDVYYYWKNYNVIFAGIVKNSGDISLNPRHPHYCSLQILDYKTFLSESNTLDYVISNKTIREAIEMVVDTVSDYGFSVGTIDISSADDVIGAYSTLNKTAYDVLQYLADISGSKWRARYIDNSSMAIDFYDPDTLPQVEDIEYTQEYWEDNNIVDLTFNYGTRDYRNKQIMLSDEVYAGIDYTELILSNGYETNFITQNNIAIIKNININGIEKDFTTQEEKELGVDADFYYTPGKNIIESATSYTAGTQIVVTYTPLVKGRQLTYNNEEVLRISTQTNTLGIIARYENRNDILSTKELEEIGKTYIEYKGKPEVILTLTTHNKDLYNIGEVVYFNSPIDELKQKYMVKSKETQYIIESETGTINLFYVYEMTSSFNSEKAINYFDNQRNKAQGNIQEGQSITRNIDINKIATIIWDNPTITETTITVVGDNILNGILNSPFIE